ncbi:hypothetical protein F7Q91_03170 [Vibrio chagasii]|uniref:Uncharacterized protein n=1 Tax=Vibrio chagasii TaxID=170679 RepID=A0A7V7NX66_9VIBR|nr:hypothetical protein [Vibrio chagasii]KAB0482423.1 hypothetical protein F7Q91_03170 [Vibrio chagasii]
MKRILLTLLLVITSINAYADVEVNPVTSEYQKIADLMETNRYLALTLLIMNTNTAKACDLVASYETLLNHDSVTAVTDSIRKKDGLDGSQEQQKLINNATYHVCIEELGAQIEVIRTNFDEIEARWKDYELKYFGSDRKVDGSQ